MTDAKKVAVEWLGDSVHAIALDVILRERTAQRALAVTLSAAGKQPLRNQEYRASNGTQEGMWRVIKPYVIGWLDDHGYPVTFHFVAAVLEAASDEREARFSSKG